MDDREFDSTVALAELDRASARIAQLEGELERHWQDGFAAGVESMRVECEALKTNYAQLEAELVDHRNWEEAYTQALLDVEELRERLKQSAERESAIAATTGGYIRQLKELREAADLAVDSASKFSWRVRRDWLRAVLAKVTRA